MSVAKADTATKGQSLEYIQWGDGTTLQFYWKHFDDGTEAYCLEHTKLAPVGTGYTKGGTCDPVIRNIVEHEPVNSDPSLNYYIKQCAVHYYLGELPELTSNVAPGCQWIADAILNLLSEAKNTETKLYNANAKIEVGNFDSNLVLNGDYFESSYITVNKANCEQYTINASSVPEGTLVCVNDNEGGVPINGATISSEQFKIKVPVSSVSGIVNISFSLSGKYTKQIAYNYEPDNQNVQRLVKINSVDVPVEGPIMRLGVTPYGKISISKVDEETKMALGGAEFQIVNKVTGEIAETLTTDTNGRADSKELLYGEYILKETKAPEKYVLNGKEFAVTINSQNKEVTVGNNIITGSVEITKVDKESKKALAGATFELKNTDTNEVVQTLTTNDSGVIKSSLLKYGSYTIHEVAAPTGYVNDAEDQYVNIDQDGEIENVTMMDSAIQSDLIINKKSDDGEVLKDVVFEVYDEKGQVVDTITTDKDGVAKSENLRYGKYTVKEVQAAEGYIINDTTFPFEVVNSDNDIVLNIVNNAIKGKIAINKIDSETKQKLAGATFELKDVEGNVLETLVTDKNGYAQSDYHKYGKYYLVETQAPNGYLLNSQVNGDNNGINSENKITVQSNDTYEVEIAEDNKLYILEVQNQIIKGKIGIDKVDKESGKSMEGVVFEVYDENGNVVDTLVTDSEGHAETDMINYGKYTVKEIKTNEGYILSNEIYSVELKENNKIYLMRVENTLKTGKLEFTKTDFVTSDVIGGAMIQIKGISETNSDVLLEFISDEAGNVVEKLPYGKYEFREIFAPEGYILSDEVGEFEIKENGEVVKASMHNEREAQVGSVEDYRPTPITEEKTEEKVKLKTGDSIFKVVIQVGLGVVAVGSLVLSTRKRKM